MLIHDINRHLNAIKHLATRNNDIVNSYINSIINDFSLYRPIDYCNNHLLNLITYRYYEICQGKNIIFDVDIVNAHIDFMDDPDITAFFDNLLENAIEAAALSHQKFIDFSISIRNNNFIVIKVSNSCDKKPIEKDQHIVTSKNNSDFHGIGIVSIERVVKKYHGHIKMQFFEDLKKFESIVIFQINN